MISYNIIDYTRSPSQDFRLFGPRPWNILATTYEQNEKKRFLSNPDPGENLVSGNLVMENGCRTPHGRRLHDARRAGEHQVGQGEAEREISK